MDKTNETTTNLLMLTGLLTEFAFLQSLAKSRTLQIMTAIATILAGVFYTLFVYYI